jgi:hypothetical protein
MTQQATSSADQSHVYILRTCNVYMQSHGGFQWPTEGVVEAPDWNPAPKCGNGLHGFLWGEGDAALADWSDSAKWIVAKVAATDIVDLGGKVKFPRAEVVFVGNRFDATQFIREHGARGAIIGITLTGGECSTLSGGARSTLTGGARSTLTGGEGSTLTGGEGSTLTGGYGSTLTGGEGSTISIRYYDGARYRIAVAYVGESGIEPNVPYKVNNKGQFVKHEGKA